MEILQNTLIKLIARQGSDSDRKNTLLNSGEFGYSTDINRLFIGNGVSNGGDVVGNVFSGTAANITTLAPAVIGDFAFDSDNNKLYQLEQNDGSLIGDWALIGGVYTAGDGHISISSSNELTLNPLSASMLDADLVKGYIIMDSGRISLSANLPFQSISTKTVTISSGLRATIGTTDVTNTKVNPLSSNLVIQSNQILAVYDGLSGQTLRYSRNVTSVTRLSAGDYKFNYGPLDTANVYPIIQIVGDDITPLQTRTTYFNNSACYVKVLSANIATADANLALHISY